MMTYADALAYLDSFVNHEKSMRPDLLGMIKLERMRRLCGQLGDPQRRFRSIVVAGTNAKGSVSRMTYGILKRSALKAGLYTSPHLSDIRERIRVSAPFSSAEADESDWISEDQFAKAVTALSRVVDARSMSEDEKPTYFEMLTAVAFLAFAEAGVDVAVLEVGLGGRLDAVNIVEPSVSVIAPIGMDHCEILGNTLDAIAREKAGIIKPGQVVLTAHQADEAAAVIARAAEEAGVPLYRYGKDFSSEIESHSAEGMEITVTGLRGFYRSIGLPMIGRHQAENAALAIAAVESLSEEGVPVSSVEHGLAECRWPGRLELLPVKPPVLLDGGHNQQALRALTQNLGELFHGRNIYVLAGMSSDKQAEALGAILGPAAKTFICTQAQHPRSMSAQDLANRVSPYCAEVHVIPDLVDAYMYLMNSVEPEDLIVATGSLYLVGELRRMIFQSRSRSRSPVATV